MDRNQTTYINLFTTGACQNMCWYCIEGCNSDRLRSHMEMDTFDNVIRFIKAQDQRHVHVHFYGGEALLHPYIWTMYQELMDEFPSIEFKLSTNLNHSYEIISQIPSNFNVVASLHSDWVEDYMDWFANAKYVQTNCNLIEVSLMIQSRNIGEMMVLHELWCDQLPVKMYPIDQFRDSLSDQELVELYDSPFEFHVEDNYGTDGCLCSAGWDIDELGNVTKCSAHKDNILLNVNDGVTKLPIWGICRDASECPCDAEFEKKNTERKGR